MLPILVFLTAGLVVGHILRYRQRALRPLGRLMDTILCFLLFVLGAKLGTNEQVIAQIDQLGFEGLCLALGSIGGSLLAIWPLAGLFLDQGGKVDK